MDNGKSMSGLLPDSPAMADVHFDGLAITVRFDIKCHITVFSVLGDAVNLVRFELGIDGLFGRQM